ncbi:MULTISPECIES: hypothetical protein [unclassified Nostoc]|uniref:hypothetical protein n=1 Tax=unclassified Nostoc TaxID=2593658 RepID=UPI002621D0E2|nr:hypothetical protein [Nostoc sp. S13]MDF5738447.1 hypothetical protein [Nostoc sp. S13]
MPWHRWLLFPDLSIELGDRLQVTGNTEREPPCPIPSKVSGNSALSDTPPLVGGLLTQHSSLRQRAVFREHLSEKKYTR